MAVSFLNFETKHAVCGSSKLKATYGGHIHNILLSSDMDNGTIISKGEYVRPDVYKQGATPTDFEAIVLDKASNGNFYVEVKVPAGALLILQVPTIYHEYTTQMQHESNFYNVEGDIVRSYELDINDIFELSAEGFAAVPEVGDIVTANTNGKLVKKVA